MADATKQPAGPGFRWQPNRGILLFTLLFLPVTLSLGFWQLDRAEEKRMLAAEFQGREVAAKVNLDDLETGGDHQYRRVTATGRFDPDHAILLDNRVRQGRPGYEVVVPFQLAASGRWLLVNRGWIGAAASRDQLPAVAEVPGDVTLSGYLYQSPGEPFTLGAEQWRERWPQVLQNLDIAGVATLLEVELSPWTLRLDASSPGALAVGWEVINVQPEKHTAYAVQWFALAAALVVLALFANSNLGALVRRRS
ncbi:MAG: SURF1 family protein [Pseudomonadota bacterium]|nr:SURF1 family protein [Pseudomonadota bacterium]